MTGLALFERCDELNVRVERVAHLATMLVDPMADVLRDWLIDDFPELLLDLVDSQHPIDDDEVWEALVDNKRFGWLVEATMFSWGQYLTRTFYGETYEAALEQAFAWAEKEAERVE